MLAGLEREENEAGLVGLEALDVQLEGLFRGGLSAVVDGDTDCGCELAGDASGLTGYVSMRMLQLMYDPVFEFLPLPANIPGSVLGSLVDTYLQLLDCEASTSASAAVIFEGRALNDRSETIDRSGGYTSSFGNSVGTSPALATGLLEVNLHTTLPVLVEVRVRDDIIVLDSLYRTFVSDVELVPSKIKSQESFGNAENPATRLCVDPSGE